MDRYHLAWLMVGKPKGIVRGRPMTPDEEAAYVREVAEQKTAALRMSLDAVERQGMPFVGETGGVRPGRPGGSRAGPDASAMEPSPDDRRPGPRSRRPAPRPRSHRAAGRGAPAAPRSTSTTTTRRAPRPPRMQR